MRARISSYFYHAAQWHARRVSYYLVTHRLFKALVLFSCGDCASFFLRLIQHRRPTCLQLYMKQQLTGVAFGPVPHVELLGDGGGCATGTGSAGEEIAQEDVGGVAGTAAGKKRVKRGELTAAKNAKRGKSK